MFKKIATKIKTAFLSLLLTASAVGSIHAGGVGQQVIFLETKDGDKMYGVNIRPYYIYDTNTILAISSTTFKVEGQPTILNYLEGQYGWTDKFKRLDYLSYTSIGGIGYVTAPNGSRPYYMVSGSLAYQPFNLIRVSSYVRYRDVFDTDNYDFSSILVGASGQVSFGKNVFALDVANSYNDETFRAYGVSYIRRF